MKKRFLLIMVFISSIIFGMVLYLKAQQNQDDVLDWTSLSSKLNHIEAKLDTISQSVERLERTVSQRMDQISNDNQKVLQELDVVKVRATRK